MAEEFVKGVLWLSAGGLLATLISGITSILVARILGPEQYGLYSLAFGAAGPLALATWFGVNTIAIKRAAESPGEAKRVLDSTLTFALVNTAAVAVVGTAAAPLLAKMVNRPELAQAVAAAAVAVAAGQAAGAARLLVAVNRADAQAKVDVVLQAARLSLA
ncbi:MAG: oligosaccharide flippase family protein, partial [Thermoproteus sp.]|nr:oligosaccharide flippase family protein [Thermoproteus sp.]